MFLVRFLTFRTCHYVKGKLLHVSNNHRDSNACMKWRARKKDLTQVRLVSKFFEIHSKYVTRAIKIISIILL